MVSVKVEKLVIAESRLRFWRFLGVNWNVARTDSGGAFASQIIKLLLFGPLRFSHAFKYMTSRPLESLIMVLSYNGVSSAVGDDDDGDVLSSLHIRAHDFMNSVEVLPSRRAW